MPKIAWPAASGAGSQPRKNALPGTTLFRRSKAKAESKSAISRKAPSFRRVGLCGARLLQAVAAEKNHVSRGAAGAGEGMRWLAGAQSGVSELRRAVKNAPVHRNRLP